MPLPDVVFLSSQLLTADLWTPQIAAFKDRVHWQVADNSSHDTMAELAASVLSKAPKNFTLIAHGMGGFIAFEMFRQAASRMNKLILISTLASADNANQTARRMRYLQLVQSGNFDKVIDERVPVMLSKQDQHNPTLVALVRKMATDTGPEAFLRQQRAIMGRIDSRPTLNTIHCPTVLIWGGQDGLTTLDQQHEMMAGIKNASLEVIEDSGHLVSLERPEHANALITHWLGLS